MFQRGGAFAAGIAGRSAVVDHFAQFSADPTGYLTVVAAQNPSPTGLEQLSGQISAQIRQIQSAVDGQPSADRMRISYLYLKAAAKHLNAASAVGGLYQKVDHRGDVMKVSKIAL